MDRHRQELEEASQLLPRHFRGSTTPLTSSFGTSGLQSCVRIHFCGVKPPMVLRYGSPKKLTQGEGRSNRTD